MARQWGFASIAWWSYVEEPCITGSGEGTGAGTAFAMVVYVCRYRVCILQRSMSCESAANVTGKAHTGMQGWGSYR
jgi:hypothetical protein